jgi:hypothetical protein
LKDRALNYHKTPKQIITGLTKDATDETIKNMCLYKSLNDQITKERSKMSNNFVIELSNIPEIPRKNIRNERFLYFDSGVSVEDRIIIYACDFSLNYLNSMKVWLIDCTFKSTPQGFFQMVTIHGGCFR